MLVGTCIDSGSPCVQLSFLVILGVVEIDLLNVIITKKENPQLCELLT